METCCDANVLHLHLVEESDFAGDVDSFGYHNSNDAARFIVRTSHAVSTLRICLKASGQTSRTQRPRKSRE